MNFEFFLFFHFWNLLLIFFICSRCIVPCLLEFGDEAFFISGYSVLHFSPCCWAVLVSYACDAVNNSVNFLSVVARNLDSSLFENMLQVPKVTAQSHNLSI